MKKIGNAFDFRVFVRLLSFAKKYPIQFWVATVSAVLLAVVSASVPYLIIETINSFTEQKDLNSLLNYTVVILAVLLIQVTLQFTFIYFANWVGQSIIKDIRTTVFDTIIQFRMKYFNTQSVGKLVTRVVSDVETIANFFSQGLFMVVSDLLKMLVVIAVMFWINWRLALISLSILPILLYATRLFQKAIKSTFQDVRNQVANLNGFVQERITGMKIVQLFNREHIEYQNFKSINKKYKEAYIKTVWYYSLFFPVAQILASIAVGLVVWYGGLQVLESDTLKIGSIIGFIKLTEMLFRPLRQIADKFNQLQMGVVAGERVFTVIDTDSFIDNSGEVPFQELQKDITFQDLHFGYIEGEPIIKGVSFTVKRGETVAIVGATGAGKTTIVNLLNRFYEFDKGDILLDATSIRKYDLYSLRKGIATVLQDVFLFSDTILNNLKLYNPSITQQDVENAAKKIGVHEFICSLPGGYNYLVKERGSMLSSGQRQLLSFLRAYLCKPSILILDEATSSVDSYSEQMIQYATDQITQDRTSIIIAHRLATIKKANKILVMDKGKIVEQGTHQELLKLKNGYYRNLYDKQFSAGTI